MSTLQRAIEIATEAHQGQLDKAGRDYIPRNGNRKDKGADIELAQMWSKGRHHVHFGRKKESS